MRFIFLTLLFFLPSLPLKSLQKDMEEEKALINFQSIQKILENDRLHKKPTRKILPTRNPSQEKESKIQDTEKKVKGVSLPHVKQKMQNKKNDQEIQSLKEINKYQIPREKEFWTFFSEYWIVKNATTLQWNFKRPDYQIKANFMALLEKLGIYEKSFKILFVNTPDITHFALPADDGEALLLISLPFMKTLRLSPEEVSILLLEDLLREQKSYFKNFVKTPLLSDFLGSNFFGKKIDKAPLQEAMRRYHQMIFEKGLNFEQQYQITVQMNSILKSRPKLWNTYYILLRKLDKLVKSDPLYKNYPRIYPSPEFQLTWLKSKNEKRIQ